MAKSLIKKNNIKIIAGVITALILGVLIISGSAQALILKLIIPSTEVEKGDLMTMTVTINLESESFDAISNINLKLDGQIETNCLFDKDGNIIRGCNGITIQKVETPIGYGYESGNDNEAKYVITIDSSKYFAGNYDTILTVKTAEKTYEITGETIKINAKMFPNGGCSLRASNGKLNLNGVDFGNQNKINLYNPIKNSLSGEGVLTAQNAKDRLTYTFRVKKIIENDKTHAVLQVEGYYRIGRDGKPTFEKSLINVDKKSNKITLIGNKLNVEYMNVNLREGCSV